MSNFVYKQPLNQALSIPFSPDYLDVQELVCGYFEAVHIYPNWEIITWLNEEGKLLNMIPNIAIKDGQLVDFLVGPMVFDYVTQEGESIGLTEEQTEEVLKWLENLPLMPFYINQTEYLLPTIDLQKGGD